MTREDQIAAEVAARYGVPVMAGAVQVLPPCTFSWQIEAEAEVAPQKGRRSGALRRQIDAQYKNLARAARLRKADAAQSKGPTAGQVARAEASALREAQLRAMVAEGLPRQVIADRLGLKVDTLEAYARGLKIKLPVMPFDQRAKSGPKRGLAGGELGADCLPYSVTANQGELVSALPCNMRTRSVSDPVTRGRGARDDLIRARVLAGEPVLHIARALGVPTPGVYRAVRRMGLPVVKDAGPSERVQVRDARIAYAKSLLDGGLDAAAVAARLMEERGVKLKTARRDLAALGQRFQMPVGQGAKAQRSVRSNIGMTPERLAALQARRALVREMAFAGAARKEIMAKAGCGSVVLARDLRALVLAGLPDGAAVLPAFAGSVDVAARDARWARIREMRQAGASLREITLAVGVSLSTVCVVCREAGLADNAKYAAGRRAVPDDEALSQVAALLAAGCPASTIRRRVGLSKARLGRLQAMLAQAAGNGQAMERRAA